VQRARAVDPRGGAAIMQGIVDDLDRLAAAARDFVLDLAEVWPHRPLREAAARRRAFEHAPTAVLTDAPDAHTTAAASVDQPTLF
jgi:hypothetical protein